MTFIHVHTGTWHTCTTCGTGTCITVTIDCTGTPVYYRYTYYTPPTALVSRCFGLWSCYSTNLYLLHRLEKTPWPRCPQMFDFCSFGYYRVVYVTCTPTRYPWRHVRGPFQACHTKFIRFSTCPREQLLSNLSLSSTCSWLHIVVQMYLMKV